MLLLTSSRSLIPRARRLLRLSMNRKISSMSALACQTQQKYGLLQLFNLTQTSISKPVISLQNISQSIYFVGFSTRCAKETVKYSSSSSSGNNYDNQDFGVCLLITDYPDYVQGREVLKNSTFALS